MRNSKLRDKVRAGQIGLALAFGSALLVGTVQAADLVPDAKAGQTKVSMCMGCHGIPGYRIAYPRVYHVPMLGGQNAKYIENALHSYKNGDRPHPTMRAIAQSLSDQDIVDIAAYYAQPKK
jgi:cytochrome c553